MALIQFLPGDKVFNDFSEEKNSLNTDITEIWDMSHRKSADNSISFRFTSG